MDSTLNKLRAQLYNSKLYPAVELLRNRWLRQSAARFTLYVLNGFVYCVESSDGKYEVVAKYPYQEGNLSSIFEGFPTARLTSRAVLAGGVALFLPGRNFLYQRLTLPAAIRGDLDDALDYQLEALFSLPVGRFLSDYQILSESDSRMDVAVLSADSDMVAELENAAGAHGLKLKGIYPLLQSWAQVSSLSQPALLVENHASNGVYSAIADGGRLLVSASVDADDGESAQRLCESSALSELPRRENLEDIGEADLLDRHADLQGADFNFLSKASRQYWSQQLRIRMGVIAGIGLLVLLLLVMLPGLGKTLHKSWLESRLASLEQQHGALFDDWSLRSRILGFEEILDEVPAGNQLELLKEVAQLLPKDSWLTYMRTEGNRIEIRGQAKQAANVITAFGESRIFSQVEFVSPVIKSPNKAMEEFSIQMRLTDVDAEGFFERYVR